MGSQGRKGELEWVVRGQLSPWELGKLERSETASVRCALCAAGAGADACGGSESSERRPSPCRDLACLSSGTRTSRARRSAERHPRKKTLIWRVRLGETRSLNEWRNNAASRSKAFLEPSLECGVCFLLCSPWALRLLLGLVPPLSLTGIRKLLFFTVTFPAKWLSDLRAGSSQDVTF